MATYTYSLAEDFPEGTINELQLQSEAGANAVSTYGDVIVVDSDTDPGAFVAAHVPAAPVADASVTWATSDYRDLAETELVPWRGNAVRVTGEYKTGADNATIQLLEDGVLVGSPQNVAHTDGAWVAFSLDFAITNKEPAVYTVQGQSPLFTTLQIRNSRIQVVLA